MSDTPLFSGLVNPDPKLRNRKRLVFVESFEPWIAYGDLLPSFLFLDVIEKYLICLVYSLRVVLTYLAVYHTKCRLLLPLVR